MVMVRPRKGSREMAKVLFSQSWHFLESQCRLHRYPSGVLRVSHLILTPPPIELTEKLRLKEAVLCLSHSSHERRDSGTRLPRLLSTSG